ncbi:MAG: NADH-quinone oxidoreductase subunit L [Dermatophilaceae bacterium]|nr:NADH-quinone oxidoreductase subunit L [Dermatophilaceae bacterium]
MSDSVSLSAQVVILAPFVAAILGLLVARNRPAGALISIAGAAVSLVAGAHVLYAIHHGPFSPEVPTVGPLPLGQLKMPLTLLVDELSAIVVVAVAIVGLAVQLFSQWYLHDDDRYGVFVASVSLFLSAMFLVVLSGDLVLTLIGWEVMGWCSYLLIGHNSRKESANKAATKAFLVTRIADLAFVIGLIILASGVSTTSITAVIDGWPDLPAASLTAAFLCLLIGVAGKSAQFPFHDWLPDAMEGPTPASALIHAATMVAAGTFFLARLFPIFVLSDPARLALAMITAVTMVGAAIIAFGQSDLKRMLAYSTLSQIALMLSALAVAPASVGAGPGVLHLLSHAMFKALLFLAIGWLSVLVAGTAAAKMSGGVRYHPQLRLPIAIGLLALAGVPPLVGFVSKESILGAAYDNVTELGSLSGWIVLVSFGVTVVLTAAYCTRAWLVLTHLSPADEAVRRASLAASRTVVDVSLVEIFTEPAPGTVRDSSGTPGQPAAEVEHDHGHAGIFPGARVSIGALAFLSVVGGLIIFTPLVGVEPHLVWGLAASSLLLILVAWLSVRRMAAMNSSGDAADFLGARRIALFDRGFGVDGIYVAVVSPVVRLARIVVTADRDLIDASVRSTVVATRWAGAASERAHTRKPSDYLVWLLLGLLVVGVSGVTLW